MVAVLDLDNSSTTTFRIFARTLDAGWSESDAAPEAVGGADSTWINACGDGPEGFLAVGGERNVSDIDATMWSSVDGSTWERFDVPPELLDPSADGFLTDVVAHGDTYLMAGNVDVDGAGTALIWIGSPATGWTAVPAANNPVDLAVESLLVDDGGTVLITGWQDGQMTVLTSTVDALTSYEP